MSVANAASGMRDITVWRGIRFGELEHPFAPATCAATVPLKPGGDFGPAPIQDINPAFPLGAATSTDSLFLNIWSPKDAAGLPVVVWVYGGGFEGGAASSPWFDGEVLARETPCVVVTFNYRVGAYGFASLDHLSPGLACTHNLGLGDVLTALEWVSQNIERFGGDAAAMTLAGHSAGGFLSAAAAVAPGAARLRAVACFSGGASRIGTSLAAAELGTRLVTELGLAAEPTGIITAAPSDVLSAQSVIGPRMLDVRNGRDPRGFGISLDAESEIPLVPRHPMDAIADGAVKDTFLLSSAALDEADGFPTQMLAIPDENDFAERADAFCGSRTVAQQYLDRSRGDVPQAWRRLLSDYIYRLPAARVAAAQRASGGRSMHLDVRRVGGAPATHGTEVPALFGRGAGARDAQVFSIFRELIVTGGVSGYSGDYAEAGEPLPAGPVPGSDLLEVWDGVERP